ncbi:T9SS type A sorting domain-containing protein [Sunxiuqinia sp. A32]|uniref:T9SS type A sorting domain-containing protein n=1 Tax=Sunxiuqinia sp. A32 TaxID=3461496 RepID=UPI0040465134
MKTIFTFKNSGSLFAFSILLLLAGSLLAQTTHDVSVTNNQFSPSSLTINVGDKVIWTNTEGSHNVNGTTANFASNPESFGNDVSTGWTFEYTFNTAGSYQYQCDPHASLGMTGAITVNEVSMENKLTVNFTGMTPHVGQDLWFSVVNTNTWMELERVKVTVEVDFSIEVMGIENGESYNIDFFADHNGNGMYDAPPTDHAWRMELMDVDGDETLDFAHNTNFTDIMWMNKLMVNFTGMPPHVGQDLWLAVINQETGEELKRMKTTAEESFSLEVMGIEVGQSYNIDFYADHNGNGMYDAPPTDHAWRMELMDVAGDETLDFAHNTNFTDIMWMHKLTVEFNSMTPHDGQDFHLYVLDLTNGEKLDSISVTASVNFTIGVYGVVPGESYDVDFYADHNGNGMYDNPPTDHAWRIMLENVKGDSTIVFTHNTNFTDIQIATAAIEFADAGFGVYPNPASDYVNVSLNSLSGNQTSVKIYNTVGSLVEQEIVAHNQKLLRYQIRSFDKGLYFISVQNGNKNYVSKFIKY